MGSVYQEKRFPASDIPTLKKAYADYVEELEYEYGHQEGYSGHFNSCQGLDVLSSSFKTYEEASAYLVDGEKGYVHAVKVGDFTLQFDNLARGRELRQKLDAAEKAATSWGQDIVNRVRSAKSKTKGCQKCGSAIAVKYIRKEPWDRHDGIRGQLHSVYGEGDHPGLYCPVCRHPYLITDTDQKKQKRLQKAYFDIRLKYEEGKKRHDAKVKDKAPFWLVGGVCPC